MILKKPYAFLIKHFRLIHIILSTLLIYIAFSFNKVHKYIKELISGISNKYDAINYVNKGLFIFIFLVILISIGVYYLMKYKKKPKTIYIITTIGYLLMGVLLAFVNGYLSSLSMEVINAKTIRFYRDTLSFTMLYQYIIIIIMIIRGLGFDIKKFNFTKDIQELNIEDIDSEEVEVNVNIDTKNIIRDINRRKRELGYWIKENLLFSIILISVILIGASYLLYKNVLLKNRLYPMKEPFGTNNIYQIDNSYISTKDGNNYIIVKFNVYSKIGRNTLNLDKFSLKIGKETYYINQKKCYLYTDIGPCYQKQYINSNTSTYILVFEVNNININKTYLIYSEDLENKTKIKLRLEDYILKS